MSPIPTEIDSILSGERLPLPNDFTLNNFRELAKIDIHALNTEEFIKFNTFLTEFFDKLVNIVGMERHDIPPIYRRIHEGISRFVKFPVSNKSYGREIESLTALFNSISKSQVFIKFPLAHDHITIFQQLGMALKTSLTKQIGYATDNSLESYFSAASESMRNRAFLKQEYSLIASSLFNIGDTCFTAENCNYKLAFSKILSILGDMTHKLDTSRMPHASKVILRHVLALQKEATKQLTPNQITEATYLFLNNAYSEQNATTISSKCTELFPSNCHFLPKPVITSTSTPSTSTSRANSTLSTPTLSPTERTEVTTLTIPSSLTENTTHLSTQTESSTSETTPASNTINAIPETAALGFLTGATAEAIDLLPDHNGLWKFAKIILRIPLPIINAYLVNLVQNVDNPEDALNTYNLLLSCSLVLGTKVFLSIADTLVKKYDLETYVKPAVLPIWLSLYTLLQNPIAGSVNYVSAVAGMLSVIGIKKGINVTHGFFTKNASESIQLTDIEDTSSTKSNSSETQKSDSKESLPFLPDPEKICYFIKKTKFNELKENFAKLLFVLNTINDFYKDEIELLNKLKIKTQENTHNLKNYISNIALIDKLLVNLRALANGLNESKHLDACKQFNDSQQLVNQFNSKDINGKISVLQTLHGLFVLIKNHMKDLPKELSEIKGKDNAEELQSDGEATLKNASITTKLAFAIYKVEGILGIIQKVFTDYDTKNAACKGKENTSAVDDTINNCQTRRHTFYTLPSTTDSSDYRTSSTTDRSSSSNQSDPDSLPEDNESQRFLIRF